LPPGVDWLHPPPEDLGHQLPSTAEVVVHRRVVALPCLPRDVPQGDSVGAVLGKKTLGHFEECFARSWRVGHPGSLAVGRAHQDEGWRGLRHCFNLTLATNCDRRTAAMPGPTPPFAGRITSSISQSEPW